MLTFLDFKKETDSGKLRNVYYIAALDNYFVSKAGEILREKLFGSKNIRDNFFLKYADESQLQEIIDLNCNFSSLFSENKVIIVKRCEKFSRKLDELFEHFKNPSGDSHLMFVFDKDFVSEKKLDGKKLDDGNEFFDFSDLPDRAIKELVRGEFESRGFSINDDELDFFIESVPQNFDLIINEIEKICSYDFEDSEKVINKELILKLIGYDEKYSPEELVHAIITKDSRRSSQILDNLLNSAGMNEIYLLSILSNYYMDLITFKTKGVDKLDIRALQNKYKMWYNRAKFAKNYHKEININALETSISKILETDMKLKTSMLDSKILMASLVEELVNS
ncbi:MAG: DNA polymerase III subunit delta [Chlorobi bacterium]|nr:DNA polymerase III subunit delta [Chlorobiota bacterium]MCI0717084.1 DNA polymerase III subunit delta [Chlorobiota bacterium]